MLWIGGDSIEGTLRPVLLGEWTSTARRMDQYWSHIWTSTTSRFNQYWSLRWPVLLRFSFSKGGD